MAEGGVSLKSGAYAAHNCGTREQHKDTGQKLAEAPTGLDAIVAAAAAEFGASAPNSPPASSSEECTSGRAKAPPRGVGKAQAAGGSGDLGRPSTDSTDLRQQEHDDHSGEGGARGSGGTERGSDKDTITNAADEDRGAECARTATGTAATATAGGRHTANASEPASAPAPSVDGKQSGKLARPEKNEPCPRCSSDQTKFCYYNNYNPNQPRFYCKGCQRYWTAGGTLRNVPPGSGRRKSKAHPKEHSEVAHNFDTVMNQGSNFPMPTNMGAQPFGLAGQDANAAAQLFAYQQQAAMLGGSPLAMQLPGMGGLTGGQWMPSMGELPGSSHYANALQSGFLGGPTALMGGPNMLQTMQQPTGTLAAAGGKDSLRGPSSQAGASRGAVRTHDSNGDNCRNVRARTDSGFSQGTGTGTGVCAEGEGSSPKLLAATQKHQDMSASSAKRGSPPSVSEMGPGLPMQDLLAQQQLMHAAWLRQATGNNGGWHGLGLLGGGLNMVSQQSAIAALAAQQQPQPGMGFPGGGVSQLGMGLNPYVSQGVFNGGMPGNLMTLGNPQSQLMAPQTMAQQLFAACSQPGGMMQGGWGTQAAQLHGLADSSNGLAGATAGPALNGTAALMAAAASTMGNNNTSMLGSGLEGMGDGGAGRAW